MGVAAAGQGAVVCNRRFEFYRCFLWGHIRHRMYATLTLFGPRYPPMLKSSCGRPCKSLVCVDVLLVLLPQRSLLRPGGAAGRVWEAHKGSCAVLVLSGLLLPMQIDSLCEGQRHAHVCHCLCNHFRVNMVKSQLVVREARKPCLARLSARIAACCSLPSCVDRCAGRTCCFHVSTAVWRLPMPQPTICSKENRCWLAGGDGLQWSLRL